MNRFSLSRADLLACLSEFSLTLLVFFVCAADPPPSVNEAHYLAKAKHYWDPSWCAKDFFITSSQTHATFYFFFGWPTLFVDLETVAWAGRFAGWSMLAAGLIRLCSVLHLRSWTPLVAWLWVAGVSQGNLAGEWVVGGIEAKVPAYGLVLWGMADAIRGRFGAAWMAMGAAAAFHVLTGGWAVVATMLMALATTWKEAGWRARLAPFATGGLWIGGLLSLPGLLPALALNQGVTPEESVSAAKIYTYFRLGHHLLPSSLQAWWYLRFAIMTAVTLWLWTKIARFTLLAGGSSEARGGRKPPPTDPPEHPIDSAFSIPPDRLRRWRTLLLSSLIITSIGLALGILPAFNPDLAAQVLRFYWFRLADAWIPLGMATGIAVMVRQLCESRKLSENGITTVRGIAIATGLLITVSYAQDVIARTTRGVPRAVDNRVLGLHRDADYWTQQRVMEDWMAVCRFIRASTPRDAVLLTPRHQQSFKWYAARAEVVNWKDVPQDARALREWARRFLEIYPVRLDTMRVTIRYDDLREFRRKYGVDWIIVDKRITGEHLPLVRVYPFDRETNKTYAVYRLPN
ncbi:MAG: DUF6798 domain-containing protein [Planctomycetota bacterium]